MQSPGTSATTSAMLARATRQRQLTLLTVACWALFTLSNLVRGRTITPAIDALAGGATLLTWLWIRGNPAERLAVGGHLTLAVSSVGLTFAALWSGLSDSVALWFLIAVPLMAGYSANARASLLWAAVALLQMSLVGLAEAYLNLPQEFVPTGLELVTGRIALLALVLAFVVTSRRTFDEQVAALEAGERELAAARDEALAAARAKASFLANMSHEIRTPLNGILGMVELLGNSRLQPDQREMVTTIDRSSRSLLMVVNEILDFSKLDAGGVAIERAPFDLERCLKDVVALLSPQARDRGLQLRAQLAEGCPRHIVADEQHLRQVLVNLAGNGLKFTNAGEVQIVAHPDPLGVLLEVRDTGIGIDAEQLPRLFRPFSQVDGSSTRRHGGTGLGLAISRRLVELMGGNLGVDSTPGVGTTFRFTLPAQVAKTPPPATGPRLTPLPTTTRVLRVLLAEDNPVNQLVVQRILEHLGYTADVVSGGLEAFEAVRDGNYDVVLMDVQMPGMDGLEATRLIRSELPAERQPWVVALTASVLAEQQAECSAAGMDDFLGKPVQIEAVAQVMQRAAGGLSGQKRGPVAVA